MNQQCSDALAAMRRDLVVECADTTSSLCEAQRLRFNVFCSERDILPGSGGIERDPYDSVARHILLRRRATGEAVGTVRLVPFRDDAPNESFPMQRVCPPEVLTGVPLNTTGEISRFALSKTRRAMGCPSDTLMRLALMQGILAVSLELGLTHWCAAMEPSLIRLLRSASVYFQPVGPVIEYRGLRQPAVASIHGILARGKRERPDVFEFVTAGLNARRPLPDRIAA